MAKNDLAKVIALVVLVGISGWLFYKQSDSSPKFDLSPYNALGVGVAEETSKLLGNKGSVLVITEDTIEFKNPAVEGQLKSFKATIQNYEMMTLAAAETFKLTRMERMSAGGAIPQDQLLKLLQSHSNIGAVVLFCAFPQLTAQDTAALKQSGTKVIVASACVPGYRKLVESQVINLAIVPQFEKAANAGTPTTLRGWFEQEFIVVSAANAAALPY
jgi:hypothetical protein